MKNILSIVLIIIIFPSCTKKDTSSSNYLNCRINGAYWTPDKSGGLGEYTLKAVLSGDTLLSVYGKTTYQTVYVNIVGNSINAGDYSLNSNLNYTNFGVYDDDNLSSGQYITDSLRQGVLNIIKLDKTNKRVDGHFYFKCFNSIINDSINVTDGNFSISYTSN